MEQLPDDAGAGPVSAVAGGRRPASLLAKRRSMAVQCYARFVTEGQGLPSIWVQLNRQELLGEDAFVRRTRAALQGAGEVVNIPRVQRRPPVPPLTGFVGRVVRVRAVPTGES